MRISTLQITEYSHNVPISEWPFRLGEWHPSRHTSTAICRTTRYSSRARGTAPTQAHRLRLGAGSKEFGFAISRHLHQNLLRYFAEKIRLPHPLSFWEGDYHSTTVTGTFTGSAWDATAGVSGVSEFRALPAQHQSRQTTTSLTPSKTYPSRSTT